MTGTERRRGDATASVATAWVDLDALARNVTRLRRHAGGADLLVPVKSDAYGHGLVPIARALARQGVGWLGVATPQEALTLRRAGLHGRILVFGPVRGGVLPRLIAHGIDLTVTDEDDVLAAGRAQAEAARAEPGVPAGGLVRARLHLKIDTGMGRLGRPPADAVRIARRITATPGCEFTAAWTHFACADDPAARANREQLSAFEDALAALEGAGLHPELRHAANSSALLTLPAARFDLVRPGLAAYGYHGSDRIAEAAPDLEPILTLTAPVVFVKRVAAGAAVSYGHRWHAPCDTTVATVRIGYGDGYPRALTNLGRAHIESASGRTGARVAGRVAGTVCMDQTMFDVGDGAVAVGDRALLFGAGGPDARAQAEAIGTVTYELLTRLTARVRRRYRITRGDVEETPASR